MATLLNRNGNTSALSAAAESDDEESCSPANADANETEELASLEMDLNEEDTDGELGKEKPVVCSQHAVDFEEAFLEEEEEAEAESKAKKLHKRAITKH